MYMRIVWGKIARDKWEEFEAAFKAAMGARDDMKGLKNHWLARDQNDADAGYSITLWHSESDMRAYWDSDKRKDIMAQLEPFYINQFTVTPCEVKYALHG